MDEIRPSEYSNLLKEIRERIHDAQTAALRTVNKELLCLYWDIGRLIIERQKGESWGKSVVKKLAEDLQREFSGVRGFSSQNLWFMRKLYLAYSKSEKLQPLVRELGWTSNLIILNRCKDGHQREFYLRMTRKFCWSKNVLIHQIENQAYEKTLLSKTSFDETLPDTVRGQAKLAVKDEYTFEFLELGEHHDERQLQKALPTMDRALSTCGICYLIVESTLKNRHHRFTARRREAALERTSTG